MERDIAVALKPEEVIHIVGINVNVIETILTALRNHGRVYIENTLHKKKDYAYYAIPTLAEILHG